MGTIRVAAAQFATGTDTSANLAKTLSMIDSAARSGARIIVLPEFCNHLSVYDDARHAWRVAIDIEGEWVSAVAERASRHSCWVQLNATVRGKETTPSDSTDAQEGRITNTNLLFDPAGALAGRADKTVLMGAEAEHLSVARGPSDVTDAGFALLGSYACMDGVVPEVPRSVAARGARVLLNSLNSFALDEASLHIPVRAAENRAWVVACCKVGPLLPHDKAAMFSEMMGVPADMLSGAGESQIVAPDGEVLERGSRDGEEVVVADIDLDRCGQLRPDGTDIWAQRRPELYGPLAETTPPLGDHDRAESIVAATALDLGGVAEALDQGADLVVMPELSVDASSVRELTELIAARRPTAHVVSSMDVSIGVEAETQWAHHGVLFGADGLVGAQSQLHHCLRHEWVSSLGERVRAFDLPWGRLGILVGDDLIYPEVARLMALDSVDVMAVPLDAQEGWETTLAAVERSAENRVITVTATRPGSAGQSVIADLPPDFTLWATSRERPFDGTINQPDLCIAIDGDAGGSSGSQPLMSVHPQRTVHRQISRGTNLVDGRPWQLCGPLTTRA